jgi:hypothetical protein
MKSNGTVILSLALLASFTNQQTLDTTCQSCLYNAWLAGDSNNYWCMDTNECYSGDTESTCVSYVETDPFACDEVSPINFTEILITDDDIDLINVYTYIYGAEDSPHVFTV